MPVYARNEDVKVLFLGTPGISSTILKALLEARYDVIGVVTQPDRESGRGHGLVYPEVKKMALEYGLPVYQPLKIREDHSFADSLDFDVIACMAYGQIVPLSFLSLARRGAVNVHGSILPAYRGAAPIQRAIMDGRESTGVSLMEMVEQMDAGDVYDTRECKIEEDDDYTSLSEKLSALGAEMIVKDLLAYANGELTPHPQDEAGVTIARKIRKDEEEVSTSLSAKAARDAFRGLSRTPGGYIVLNGEKLKVYRTRLVDLPGGEEGDYLLEKKRLLVRFKDGWLSLLEVQPSGKRAMDAVSFLNGVRTRLPSKGKIGPWSE